MRSGICFDSPLGILYAVEERGFLVELSYEIPQDFQEKETELLLECKRQVEDYFKGNLQFFDLPLNPKGSEFQKKVWRALLSIPYGETRSYGEIAKQIGKEKAARAIGGANHVNPISIVIPCHRVIGANGKLVGYAGGMQAKEFLLALEKKEKNRK